MACYNNENAKIYIDIINYLCNWQESLGLLESYWHQSDKMSSYFHVNTNSKEALWGRA